MPSQLSFSATKLLRDKLLLRNLTPYTKPGVYTPTSKPAQGDLIQSDTSVIDSPDVLIDNSPFSDKLYTLNEYGPLGGYDKNIDGLINTVSNLPNQGPYGAYPPYTDALELYSTTFQKRQYIKNVYGPQGGYLNIYDIGDIIKVQKNATYWDPPSFRPSSYSPFAVLLQEDPTGDNGLLSQDSEMAQLATERAKYSFKQRVDQNVRNNTIGRVNILNGFQDPANLSLIIAGRRPIIDRDWKITSGGDILSQGQDIVQRIAGYTFPVSPIPGDYFQARDINSSQSAVEAALRGTRGGLFGLFGNRPTSPSQLFLDYTGSGQRQQLTSNLDYNFYRPKYNTGGTGILSALGNAILGGFADSFGAGNYYVGSPEREPGYLTSPPGQIPIDQFGAQVSAPVYGPDILGKEYEGIDKDFSFGLNGRSFESDGNITGGFSWVSGKWAPNAGRKQKPGGDYGTEDSDFSSIADQFESTKSINYEFKAGSILDDTQRLIDSQPNSGARFGHVGNAIDQTSKIFNDGYKEITKGSQVIKYTDGQANVGIEYCRIFTKDTPYYTFNDLQTKDGNIRKFSYSVMDSTFSTNIVPAKGGDAIVDGQVKKYMFSIENLAWRTGYRPGYRVDDLPTCEKGPNGGRVMWFPPYGLEFSEDTRPQFNETTFLGRPEPIYTYKNTSRSGTLKWKMIVDHPSVLNLIVNKVLANEGDRQKVDSIVNSFFAGCKKYDLYDLARIYNTVPLTDLQAWQQIVTDPNVSQEQFKQVSNNLGNNSVGTDSTAGGGTVATPPTIDFSNYRSLGFYFENDIPTAAGVPFQNLYETYTSEANKTVYANQSGSGETTNAFFSNIVENNFNQLVEMGNKIYESLSQKQVSKITIEMIASASPPQEKRANKKLGDRRLTSAIEFFKTYPFGGTSNSLNQFIDDGNLIVKGVSVGEETNVSPKGNGSFGPFNCTDNDPNSQPNREKYTPRAMACRTSLIKNITVVPATQNAQPTNNAPNETLTAEGKKPEPQKPKQNSNVGAQQPQKDLYKGASKKLLRYLLNECDYFEVLKADNPFIYDSIKEKIKYFQPSFHSQTPEGLNARLTFLQQCMRPGDTIPTIGPKGEKLYNDATNTSFGAPPVLVLRVGDFYNTKIIPTSLNFNYDSVFDMNPEGIGFQPMIVEVSLGFNFVGGSGLKNPIDTLQNALSFNYYANTEMYDERAEATEDTSKLDKQIVDALKNQNPVVGVSNTQNNRANDGGNTIGVLTSTGTTSGLTGTIEYATFMNGFVNKTKDYYTATLNMMDNVLLNYNWGVLSLLNFSGDKNIGYNEGKFNGVETTIYGKPLKTEEYIRQSFVELEKNIDDGTLSVFTTLDNDKKITNSQKKLFKKNYKNYLNNGYKSSFSSDLFNTISTLVQVEQDFVYNVDRLNFVTEGSSPTSKDGRINDKGIAQIFSTTGTTETSNGKNTLTALREDYAIIAGDTNDYLTSLTTANIYVPNAYDFKNAGAFTPPSGFVTLTNPTQTREYLLMSKAMMDKNRESFVTALIEGLDIATSDVIRSVYEVTRAKEYNDLNAKGLQLVSSYRTSPDGKKYLEYTPSFGTTQTRITNTSENTNASNDVKKTLQNIYSGKNDSNKDNPYNFKSKFN